MDMMPVPYRESRLHSLLKAFSWRILATLTTATIAFFVVGEVMTAALIGSIEFFLKFGIYYLHERAWQLIPDIGKTRLVQSEPVIRP